MSDNVLRVACVHGQYAEHSIQVTDNSTPSSYTYPCSGGRLLSVVEVVEWIREQDAGLLERLAET